MTQQLNRMPTYQEGLTQKGVTSRGWYSFWAGLLKGQPTGNVSGITVSTSPFSYVAPSGGFVIVQGGTTTQVQFSRDGVNFFITGATAGMFPVSQGDTLVVTYSLGPPNMTFVPQ